MAIRKIDKNIGIVPNWGDDDFDANVHGNFIDLKEIIPKINNTTDDIDLAVIEMNILKNQGEMVTSTASDNANTAVQKASEANASANQALYYYNLTKGLVVPPGTSYSVDQINTQNSAMTKAQFSALAAERMASKAGSGFEEYGKHYSNITTNPNVNEGIWTGNSVSYINKFQLGTTVTTAGTSKTTYPIANIDGIVHKIFGVAYENTDRINAIKLPVAPNIYPYDTVLTPEQVNSGVIKHADSSNSGLIVNGKFDTDTSGWSGVDSTITVSSGKLLVTPTVSNGDARQNIATINGKKYIVEVYAENGTGVPRITATNATPGFSTWFTIPTGTRYVYEFTATGTAISLIVQAFGGTATFDNIAMYPADAISRSDLALLESWHEDVSEKGFVYNQGNVQSLATTGDCGATVAGSFTGSETYSLFGKFQVAGALVGKGYVWTTLTESLKRAFLSNPENNCYLDGDKVIQGRFRIPVIMGEDTNSMAKAIVQGKAVIPSTTLYTAPTSIDYGLYTNTTSTYTYAGTTAGAIPIALIGRRNQGMYHPVYNANGTKKAVDGNFWYNTTETFTSISDCFNPAKLLTASGYIGSVSGRPDGLFYDQVHESDIIDLRNSSKKVEDYNRLIGREFNKLVAGTYRGKEREVQTHIIKDRVLLYGSFNGGINTRGYFIYNADLVNLPVTLNIGEVINLSVTMIVKTGTDSGKILSTRNYTKLNSTYFIFGNNDANPSNLIRYTDGTIPSTLTGQTVDIYISYETTRTKSNTLLHCNIIGNPANYPDSWKQSGVFGTPLVVAEDGTSLLPDGTIDTFKLSRPVKQGTSILLCLRSTDNGVTWTSFTPTFSTTTNAITLTDEPAANIVMVYYQTHTNMATAIANGEVIESGKVLGTDGIANSYLISTLIGKVPTANTAPYLQDGYNINAYRIDSSTLKFSTTATELPTHTALSLAGGASGVPAVKVFPYLTRANGKAYLNLVFKEMKHNGTSWGDDSKFNIVDNVSTTTDNNAQTVLVGQKTVELPYFIGADE